MFWYQTELEKGEKYTMWEWNKTVKFSAGFLRRGCVLPTGWKGEGTGWDTRREQWERSGSQGLVSVSLPRIILPGASLSRFTHMWPRQLQWLKGLKRQRWPDSASWLSWSPRCNGRAAILFWHPLSNFPKNTKCEWKWNSSWGQVYRELSPHLY